ncbi:MAG: tetratricopeptide repeat protein [Methylococcales bacterium]|nr:tetratricopeptide repeat protein [Methylococcales bacterium]MDD5631660.1 tetratricopeptide repeat protein [Methylococcales bacterium]
MFRLLRLLILSCLFSLGVNAQAEEPPAFLDIQQSAGQGDAKAQAKLGAMYILGRGVEKDEQRAAEWMLKAAKQGNIDAEVIIAAMYDRGMGVKNDVKMATGWYEKAAAQGNTTSMAILGKNDVAKGGVAFSYQGMRLSAAKQIPAEYAKRILLTK